MQIFKRALTTLQISRQAYLALNLAYYGMVAVGMLVTVSNRSLQERLSVMVGEALTQGVLSIVAGAYQGALLLAAIGLTFLINLFLGSVLVIGLPSLIIPFSGLAVGLLRAFLWGILFTPGSLNVSGGQFLGGILAALLILLEGQGYVLAMLAAYLQGIAFLFPGKVGAESHWQGLRIGLLHSLRIYLLAVVVLAIAAVYEALIVIYLLPRLV